MSSAHVERALALAVIIAGCGPATGPRPTNAGPTVAMPAPPGVRWRFDGYRDDWVEGARTFDDGVTAWFGHAGRRATRRGLAIVQAPTLIPEDLVGVVRDAGDKGAFAFIDRRGDVHVAADPLAPFTEVRKGPSDAKQDDLVVTTGKATFVVMERLGRAYRSTDAGRTWSVLALTKLERPLGGIVDLALTTKGDGLALLDPQRLLATHDDGQTWSPLAEKHGLRSFARTASDGIFVETHGETALLFDGKALRPAPKGSQRPTTLPDLPPSPSAHVALLGDRVVRVRALEGSLHIAIGKLDSEPFLLERTLVTGLGPEIAMVSAYGAHVVILYRAGEQKELEVLRSMDGGATFAHAVVGTGYGGAIYAGPRDFEIMDRCGAAPAMVRPAGSSGVFVPFGADESLEIRRVAFDDKRAFLITELDGKVSLHVLDLDKPALGAPLAELTQHEGNSELNADGKGVTLYTPDGDASVMRRFGLDGKPSAPVRVPFRLAHVAFDGTRGVANSDDDRAYETSDGGLTWTAVGWPRSEGVLACSAFGCITPSSIRIGWSASTAAPVPTAPIAALDKQPPLRCTLEGSWSKDTLDDAPTAVDLEGGVAWIGLSIGKDDAVAAVVADPSSVLRVPMLAAAAKPKGKSGRVVTKWLTTRRGAIALRYSFEHRVSKNQPYGPVDAELAWVPATTKKVARAKLPKLDGFRISSFASQPDAFVAIAGDALVFRPGDNWADLYVLRDGKKPEVHYGARELDAAGEAFLDGKALTLLQPRWESISVAATRDGAAFSSAHWHFGAAERAGLWGTAVEALGLRGDTLSGIVLPLGDLGPEASAYTTWSKPLASVPVCAPKLPTPGTILKKREPLVEIEGTGPPDKGGPRPLTAMRVAGLVARGGDAPCLGAFVLKPRTSMLRIGNYEAYEGGYVSARDGRGSLFHKSGDGLVYRPMKCALP